MGYDTGQGLSIGLGVPFVGVHHMLAHLLAARMVHALESGNPILSDKIESEDSIQPKFPFLTLLVSGGHTMLLSSHSLTTHRILANTIDIAIGDMLDKAARDVLPASVIASAPGNISNPNAICYGQLLEDFCFPQGGSPVEYAYYPPRAKERKKQTKELLEKYGDWKISEPLKQWAKPDRAPIYSFVGMGSEVKRAVEDNKIPEEDLAHRRAIGREAMIRVFEHVISRVVMALKAMAPEERAGIKQLVISGGVASNMFLRHLAKKYLRSHGFGDVKLVTPPPRFCTDNAAMIAWTGLEIWREGWETELGVFPIRKWTLNSDVGGDDVKAEDVVSGLFGADGWKRRV